MVLLAAVLAWTAAGQQPDDWAVSLGGQAAPAAADTGILGMTAEDLAAYVAAQTQVVEADAEVPDDFIRGRRRFVMREFRFNADWDTDPTAVPAFVDQFKRRTGMDAQSLQPRQPLSFDDPELGDWPFVFMTAHNAFTMNESEVQGLRRYLRQGGFLYADDCLYGFPFGPAFHGELRKVFPDLELVPFNLSHPIFGTLLHQKYGWAVTNEAGLPPVLKANPCECLAIDGRMAVIYTAPDIGCLWEISSPPTPSNPLGTAMHNLDRVPGLREAAYRLSVNLVLYSMTH